MKYRQLIKTEKIISVSTLSIKFKVTEETIRRYLNILQEEGLLTRTFGGAIINQEKTIEGVHYFKRANINSEEKQIIAQKALSLIKGFSSIGFDSSTTSMELLKLLNDRDDLTILTNSAYALGEMSQSSLKMISTGGILNKNSLSLQGSMALNTIKNYKLDALFISCKGLAKNEGIFDTDEMEAEIKRQFIFHSNIVFLLVDHSKFDKVAFVKVADISHIDFLVTNKEPDQNWKMNLQENHIQVVY